MIRRSSLSDRYMYEPHHTFNAPVGPLHPSYVESGQSSKTADENFERLANFLNDQNLDEAIAQPMSDEMIEQASEDPIDETEALNIMGAQQQEELNQLRMEADENDEHVAWLYDQLFDQQERLTRYEAIIDTLLDVSRD